MRFSLIAFMLTCLSITAVMGQSAYDKKPFYKAMSSKDVKLIDDELQRLKAAGDVADSALIGAMVMKKSGYTEGVSNKLSTFIEGRKILERAILAQPANPEYRFLRIMIQENAPGILGYSDNLNEDAKLVNEGLSVLDISVKNAIVNYSKDSEILNVEIK